MSHPIVDSTAPLSPVPFHGQTLFVTEIDGQPYTPMRPIVEGMGLAWKPQFTKIKNRAERWGVTMMVTPSQGGEQATLCLPLRKLPGWLMSVNPSKVAPSLRSNVVLYQNECDDALWDFWTKGQAVNKRIQPEATRTTAKPKPIKPEADSDTVRVFHSPAHSVRVVQKVAQRSSADQRKRVNNMMDTIDKKLVVAGIYLGRQLISKMVASQFGIDTVCDVIASDIHVIEEYLEQVIFNLDDAGPCTAPKLNASRPIPKFKRLDPVGDTVKDHIEEIMVSIENAGKEYETFLTVAKGDFDKLTKQMIDRVNSMDMNGVERHLLRETINNVSHTFREQTFAMMVAGNAIRPLLFSLIRMGEMVEARDRFAAKAALPAGRARPRSNRAALPA